MVLHLSPSRLISEVQTEFNNIYPYLKVEFYSKAGPGRGKHHLAHSLSLKHAGLKKAGEFQLSDKTTVMQFEKDLKEKFSLTGQICRKSGNIWLETTITDNWTLKQQNEHGKELSSPANKKPNQESPEIMN